MDPQLVVRPTFPPVQSDRPFTNGPKNVDDVPIKLSLRLGKPFGFQSIRDTPAALRPRRVDSPSGGWNTRKEEYIAAFSGAPLKVSPLRSLRGCPLRQRQ